MLSLCYVHAPQVISRHWLRGIMVYQKEGTFRSHRWSLNTRFIFGLVCQSGFPCGAAGKESTCNEGDLDLIPGSGRFPGEGNSYPLHYFGLEKSMDSIVHGIAKRRTQLSNFHFHFMARVSDRQSLTFCLSPYTLFQNRCSKASYCSCPSSHHGPFLTCIIHFSNNLFLMDTFKFSSFQFLH